VKKAATPKVKYVRVTINVKRRVSQHKAAGTSGATMTYAPTTNMDKNDYNC